MIIPILIAVIVGGGLLLILISRGGGSKSSSANGKKGKSKGKPKSQAVIIKECMKKLSHAPRDPYALTTLADIYFSNRDWENALKNYNTLYELSSINSNVDKAKITLRQGICHYKLERYEDALTVLSLAYQSAQNGYEQNYYLGCALYRANEFEKAIACLKKAQIIKPEATEINEPLGYSYYKSKHYKEALPFLRNVLNENPENKETLFSMACAMSECGYDDKALKVFVHLRPDPTYGPQSCIEAGRMHMRSKQTEAAIQDYEIGLKIENTPPEIQVQIKYNLAGLYINANNLQRALTLLNQIELAVPNYKDVPALITRYQELNQNANLQKYLLGPTSDFAVLCRKIVGIYYPKGSFVKILDVNVGTEYTEVICEVETPKWEDKELFRFYRTQGSIGELQIRDFHATLRESKCDKGICLTIGTFSEEGKRYTEGRPIDLVEKNKLTAILKKITS